MLTKEISDALSYKHVYGDAMKKKFLDIKSNSFTPDSGLIRGNTKYLAW